MLYNTHRFRILGEKYGKYNGIQGDFNNLKEFVDAYCVEIISLTKSRQDIISRELYYLPGDGFKFDYTKTKINIEISDIELEYID